ncbi:MAG TPA: group 1 truncated hemoglobin [Gemmatimonadales bacterium]|nr:group 1 truncated hemoglobin [Gemmatimonadales bacterium]
MSRSSLLVAVCVLPLAWAGCGRPTPQPATAPPPATPLGGTLYRRVGGYDALAGVADEILRRWMGDAQLAPFFEDLSTPEKERVRQMLVDQLCAVTGGPCVYVGQDMETAHRALEISAADWDRAVTHVVGALNYFSVRPRERDELLGILGSVRDQIVTR